MPEESVVKRQRWEQLLSPVSSVNLNIGSNLCTWDLCCWSWQIFPLRHIWNEELKLPLVHYPDSGFWGLQRNRVQNSSTRYASAQTGQTSSFTTTGSFNVIASKFCVHHANLLLLPGSSQQKWQVPTHFHDSSLHLHCVKFFKLVWLRHAMALLRLSPKI